MKLLKIGIFTIIAGAGIPMSLYAVATFGTLVDLADTLAGGVVTSLSYLMFTLAVVAFFWGIVQFIWSARQGGGGKGVENGKQFMLWGLIALFVMFSVWGIITFAQGVLDIKGETTIVIPNIQLLGGSSSGNQQSSGAVAPSQQQSPGGASPSQQQSPGSVPSCRLPTVYDGTRCVDPICQAKGPNVRCTTTDASGASVSGYCNGVSQCVPDRTSGPTQGSPCVKSVCSNGTSCTNVNGTYQNGECIVSTNGATSSGGSVGFGGSCDARNTCSGNLKCDGNNQCRYPEGTNCTEDFECAGAGVCDVSTKKCM